MLPLARLQPFYPGQLGVHGSDVMRGIRWAPTAIVLFVDDNHNDAADAHDGTDPEHPLATVQGAVNKLISHQAALAESLVGSVIVVAAEASITEDVIVPNTAPQGCAIIGAGASRHHPTWQPGTAAGIALDIRVEGWTVEGFTFETFPGGGTGSLMRLCDTVPAAADNAYKIVIRNCQFDGLWSGNYGVNLYGAPHRVRIEDCQFLEFHNAGGTAFAIYISGTPNAPPYECEILNNVFWENDNHIGTVSDSFNMSLFQGNVFHLGALNPAAVKLDLRNGGEGHNVVVGNVFYGTYSQAAGYYPNAAHPDHWVGNISSDVASPQVADNGFTVAAPV